MVFERDGEEETTDMAPGSTLIVPQGTWHRAVGQRGLRMLFLTYGAGTQHKPA